ncbi:MAG: tRNA (N(6)-L-threonylcarbamoyladenosine(37)-C(2))-methylthiotransferase MtaB, partial [Candidatus Neoclostridium sp.]
MEKKIKVVVFSLGCKVNQYEGRAMVEKLNENGFDATDKLSVADAYIINTCSVTAEADKKSRQAVARMLKYNPSAKIYICGCSSQNNASQYEDKPNIRMIFGSFGKISAISSIMSDIVLDQTHKPIISVCAQPEKYEDNLTPELTKSRAFIKVQDGCNNFCSYCIVPYLRGRSRSRSIESVVAEAKDVCVKTHEIVITGINVSAYGQDNGSSLESLIDALACVPVRKRFGSLECNVITDGLLEKMKAAGFCDSFHLSMQSGSTSVLKRMNRHYTSEEFLDKIALIRKHFPNAGITTDVIVAFPGETDEEFEETLQTVKKAHFLDMHVFPYSIRHGTKAATLPQVDGTVADARVKRMLELKAEANRLF